MYAIVEMAGQQFKVAKDQKVFVHRLPGKEGDKVTFEKVLLLDDGKVTIGAPAIAGAAVTAKILGHLKGDKVIVFKKKRRKGYRKKNGHRQAFTEIQVVSIAASGHKAAKATKKETPAKPKAKKEVAKKETTAKPKLKKEAVKKETPKKEVTKKAAPKKSAKADDLKKIEGVGPKAMEAMVNAGLDTFEKVSKAKPEAISKILNDASSRMAHLVTDSWPKQAKMAAEGKWDELKEWQDNTKGGVE